MPEKNYFAKITILCLATSAGILAVWFALIREQSADWISSQIVHQASPYAVSEINSGLIINNVVLNYEFRLPRGFKTSGARNLNFFMEEAGRKKCEIRHYYAKAGREKPAADAGKLVIRFRETELVFELADKNEANDCEKYLLGIKNNLLAN